MPFYFSFLGPRSGRRWTKLKNLSALLLAVFISLPVYSAAAASDSAPAKDRCCNVLWRTYTRAATPEVEQLFRAARNADEDNFARLIVKIPDLQEYAVAGQPLLSALLYPVAGLGYDREKKAVWWDLSESEQQRLLKLHEATLPAKTRMLELALKHGAGVKDLSYDWRYPPLHLAVMFGTPKMVSMLLEHGADPNQIDGDRSLSPVEFALNHEFFVRMTYLPQLVAPSQRSEMLMSLLAAGAGRPYSRIDEKNPEPGESALPRPSADYLLWPALVELTEGSHVLAAMAKTGTTPAFDSAGSTMTSLEYAARSGNVEAVRWLKSIAPHMVSDGDPYGAGEKKVDLWLRAAVWALYPLQEGRSAQQRVHEILTELIGRDMAWGQDNNSGREPEQHVLKKIDRPQARAGHTLLHHLVFVGNVDWVRRVVSLGAPVDGVINVDKSLPVTPLAAAVGAGDVAMVKLLLELGANPLAGPRLEYSALFRAIRPETEYGQESSPEQKKLMAKRRRETLAAMLPALTSSQKEGLARDNVSLLAYAFQGGEPVDAVTVRLLLASGFTVGLDTDSLVSAMRSDDPGLIIDLLDRGVKIREIAGNDNSVGKSRSSSLLLMALFLKRADLLERLLAAGADPNSRDSEGYNAVEMSIRGGNHAALDMLLARGGRLDAVDRQPTAKTLSPLQLAIISGDKKMVTRIAALGNGNLSQVCLPGHLLAGSEVLGASDEYWRFLLDMGLGKASGTSACAGSPMPEMLVQALLDDPESVQAGWLVKRLKIRLQELWALSVAGDLKSRQRGEAFLREARTKGRDDIVQALLANGVHDQALPKADKARVLPKPVPGDKLLQKALSGHYYLSGVREVGSELLLKTNGEFEYMLAYGAVDEYAQGRWSVRKGRVFFETSPAKQDAGLAPFRLILDQPAPKVDDGSKLSVSVVYNKQVIPDVSVSVIGCKAPEMARGLTGSDSWTGQVSGAVCQIVLYHAKLNEGRSYIHIQPTDVSAAMQRHFVFEAQLQKQQSGDFNVEMDVEKGELLWQRSGRELRYNRQ